MDVEKNPYADIIHLPHHKAPNRPHMSLYDRAAQFSPFAALTGFDGVIAETARLTDRKVELSDSELNTMIDDTELSGVREANEGDNLYGDEHIRDMILFVLGDLAEENSIHCDCPDGEGDFLVDQTRDSVRISCKKCGCERTFFCRECMETRLLLDAAQIKLIKE